MRATTLFSGGLLAALAVASVTGLATAGAASASTTAAVSVTGPGPADTGGSAAACTQYAYQAIRAHVKITGIPAACRGLRPGQVSLSASTAIRMVAGTGAKSLVRRRAGEAEPWVAALLGLGPLTSAPADDSGALSSGVPVAGGSRVVFSEVATQVGGLIAWLATAASGGWALLRWWLATGGGFLGGLRRLRRGSGTAAPPFVTIGHFGFGLLGLLLWAVFVVTGSAPLAWACVALLGPITGLGMGVLLLGLPSPRGPAGAETAASDAATVSRRLDDGSRPAAVALTSANGTVRGGTAVLSAPADQLPGVLSRRSRGRLPVVAIAVHGVFATAALMFVILAAIGAG